MNTPNPNPDFLEQTLPTWQPRPPSKRLERRIFGRLPRNGRWTEFWSAATAPTLACLTLAVTLLHNPGPAADPLSPSGDEGFGSDSVPAQAGLAPYRYSYLNIGQNAPPPVPDPMTFHAIRVAARPGYLSDTTSSTTNRLD